MRPLRYLFLAAVLAACGGAADLPGVTTSPGLEVEVIHSGLVGPTQFVVLNDDELLVATINGGEDDGLGQVVEIDHSSGELVVIEDLLDKPTGIAVIDDDLWIMESDRLSRTMYTSGVTNEEPRTVVLDDLPNNGRSEGSLTVTPEGQLMFDTSGSRRGGTVVVGSGRIFTLDPGAPSWTTGDAVTDVAVEVASGFKHAYAQAFDGSTLWTTEMTDGRFDDQPAADELLAVVTGADHGWPRCVGNNRVVAEFGGTEDECAEVPQSLATFNPGASPTSVAISPFDAQELLVALWSEGRVVAVDINSEDPEGYVDVISGLNGPLHLVAAGNSVYVSEFGEGRILRITEN